MSQPAELTSSVSAGAVLQAPPTGLALIGSEGWVLGINPEFSRIVGYSGPDPVGRPLTDLFGPLDQSPEIRSALDRLARGEPVEVESWWQRKDETPVAVSIVAAPIDLGNGQAGWYCLVRDTTDQMLAAEEYARAVSLHRATLESTADGLLVVDHTGQVLSYNERFLDMWRIPESIAASGRDADMLAYVLDQLQDPAGFLDRVSGLYADPEASSYDDIPLRDGRVFERYSQPQRIAGRSAGRVWSFRDVTERRRSEGALRESQHLLEVFFSQSLDGFFFMMLDEPVRWDDGVDKEAALEYCFTHQRITKVNEALLAQYGARAHQMIGRTPAMLFAHDPVRGRARWRRFFDAGRLHIETAERRLDGTPITIEGDYICLYDAEGRITGHFGIQRDVTERRRGEEALRFSEDKFAKAFRAAPMRVSIGTLAEGRFVEVNDTFLRDHGFTREQVIGRTSPELGLWADPGERRRLVEALEHDGVVRDFEFHGQTKDGRIDITSLSAEVIQVGDEPCILAVATNITERRLAEEEIRRSRQELRDLTARLQLVREEERTFIAREIHDELGQALTGLKLDLSWLKTRLRDTDLLERVQSIVVRIDGTIDSVRRIATQLRPSVLDDLGLVAAIEWQAQEFERRTGIATGLEVQSAHPEVDGLRATTVFRILQETLTNVARHAEATRVEIALRATAAELTLDVRDNGRGIGDAEITGPRSLGLVGIRERAIACGGHLHIEGTAGQGTTLSVRIPLGSADAGDQPA
jgi:PAS domain S-box-containing protein